MKTFCWVVLNQNGGVYPDAFTERNAAWAAQERLEAEYVDELWEVHRLEVVGAAAQPEFRVRPEPEYSPMRRLEPKGTLREVLDSAWESWEKLVDNNE